MLYPIPYQSPAPVVFGPFSPDNMGEYANIQGWIWNTGTSTNNGQHLYGVPFTLQSSVLAQAIWATPASPGNWFQAVFAIYDDAGNLKAQVNPIGQTAGTPITGYTFNWPTYGLIPLLTPVTLPPGNYYLCFAMWLVIGGGGTGLNGSSTTTPIQTNVALGIKEADISSVGWPGAFPIALPSTVTWRTPTVTQCALVQMQGIGVTI